MSTDQAVKNLREALVPLYGKGESDAIIRLIFHHLKGWNLTDILIHKGEELSPFITSEIESILKRLLNYEPIQYITGEARFHGMELNIKPGVLIPRPETEELVDIIIDQNKEREDLRVLDLCTGSGCIAIALARNLPFSKVTAVDISDTAIGVAIQNAEKLKTKVKFLKEDILRDSFMTDFGLMDSGPLSDKFDIIVSNPPYVMDREAMTMERNVLDYEPHEALFVRDEDPLVFYNRIAEIARKSLAKGGRLYLEINPLTADSLRSLLESKGFDDLQIILDSFGKKRFIIAHSII